MFVCFYVLKSNTVNVIYKWEQAYALGLIEIQYICVYVSLRCCEGKVEMWYFLKSFCVSDFFWFQQLVLYVRVAVTCLYRFHAFCLFLFSFLNYCYPKVRNKMSCYLICI